MKHLGLERHTCLQESSNPMVIVTEPADTSQLALQPPNRT